MNKGGTFETSWLESLDGLCSHGRIKQGGNGLLRWCIVHMSQLILTQDSRNLKMNLVISCYMRLYTLGFISLKEHIHTVYPHPIGDNCPFWGRNCLGYILPSVASLACCSFSTITWMLRRWNRWWRAWRLRDLHIRSISSNSRCILFYFKFYWWYDGGIEIRISHMMYITYVLCDRS